MTDQRRDPARLSTALARLDEWLVRCKAPIVEYLAPGISADAAERQFADFGFAPCKDLVTWYGWHDGTRTPAGAGNAAWELVPGAFFTSLLQSHQEAINLRHIADIVSATFRGVGLERTAADCWNPGWWPILRHLGPYHQALSCDSATPGIWFIAWDDEPRCEHPDLATFVEQQVHRFETGVYSAAQDGMLGFDQVRLDEIEPERTTAW